MASVKGYLVKYRLVSICMLLLISTACLRFTNLGYSDYHGDEFKAFIAPEPKESTWQFLLKQRKGPMQFLVSYIPYTITRDFTNEFAERLPFALASCLATVVFFLFVLKLTKNLTVACVAGFLLLSNGYITGFGRIAQYQNLNLLFSFSALLAYTYLLETGISRKRKITCSLLGTLFWSMSILSHWDAVLILPMVLYIIIKGLRKDTKIIALNFLFGCLLILPFMLPYFLNFKTNDYNQVYLSKRTGFDLEYSKFPLYKSLTEVYNPYIVIPFLISTSLISLLHFKKNLPVLIWFMTILILFELFVINPGTHIYNFLLPMFILSGSGVSYIVRTNKYVKLITIPVTGSLLAFMYLQTYALFVDHAKEYPYESKTIRFFGRQLVAARIDNVKPPYMRGSYIPLFGFPHNRFWTEINSYVNSQNTLTNENLRFVTNEDKAFCDNYMDAQYGMGQNYYAVGIKRPTNFVMDYSFSNVGSKSLVYRINLNDETVVKIYRVRGKTGHL